MVPRLTTDRLIELITSNPTRSACECLNLWKAEFERELAEYDVRLKQDMQVMVDESLYYPRTAQRVTSHQ